MIIKSGRRLYKINKKDRIMHRVDNCWDRYEIITQLEPVTIRGVVIGSPYPTFLPPKLSKRSVEKLIKEGKLVLAKDKYVEWSGLKFDLYRIR